MSECLKKSRLSPKTIPNLAQPPFLLRSFGGDKCAFLLRWIGFFVKKKRTPLGVRMNMIDQLSRLRRLPQAYLVTQLHSGFNRLPLQGA